MATEDRQRQAEAAGAIREVLAAEAAVRDKVEACRADLAQALADEQQRARRIEQRTDQRLARLHTHCEKRIEQKTAELRARAGADAPPEQPDDADRECLNAAVEQLAARLIGAGDG
ncbi:MAG: hypothetical protein ACLFSC_12025 [Wenzhouxiangella sp.]